MHIYIDQIHHGSIAVQRVQSRYAESHLNTFPVSSAADLLLKSDNPGLEPFSPLIELKLQLYFSALPRSRSNLLCSTHFWFEDVTGLDIGRELAESWYRNSEFNISRHAPSSGSLTNALMGSFLLETDRFKLGLKPQELIGDIACDLHLTHNDEDRDDWTAAIKAALLELTNFKHGTRIHLRLFFVTVHDDQKALNELITFIDGFSKDLLSLRKAEYRLTLVVPMQLSFLGVNRFMMNEHLQTWVEELDCELVYEAGSFEAVP